MEQPLWIALMFRRVGAMEALCAFAVLWLIAGTAQAAGGQFGVSAQVVSRTAATQALEALPAPPQARRMARLDYGDSYVVAGDADTAAGFYRAELPRQGYRLVHASADQLEQQWAGPHGRVALTLRETGGPDPLTRIVVRAGG